MGVYSNIIDDNNYFSRVNIPASVVNELCLRNNTDVVLTENKVVDAFTNIMKPFADFGISTNKVMAHILKADKEITVCIKKNGLNSDTFHQVSVSIEDMYTNIVQDITISDKMVATKFGDFDKGRIKASIYLLMYILMTNTVASLILSTLLGEVGDILTVVIVAPINEEAAKHIAVKGGFEKEFTVVMNTYEFTSYYKRIKRYGVKPFKIVIVRGAAVMMHVTTTVVQYIAANAEKLGIKVKSKEEASLIGQWIGMIIHASYNATLRITPLATKLDNWMLKDASMSLF